MSAPVLLLLLAVTAADADRQDIDRCGDLDALAAGATEGTTCAAIQDVLSCLSDLSNQDFETEPNERLLANGTIVSATESLDAGVDNTLPIDPDDCATYASQSAAGGAWRDALLAECVRVAAQGRSAADRRSQISELLARATRLASTCAEAQSRIADAALRAKAAADAAAQAAFLKDHREIPRQAISAVICRTDRYRRWARAQVKLAERVGGVDNLVAAEQLRQLVRFLDIKIDDAEQSLRLKFGASRRSCSAQPVRSLATCAMTPTLLDGSGHAYVDDPEETCETNVAHFDWYQPHSGWYLGAEWFQPTRN